MRLDHIAYRVKDRLSSAQFICDAFGYSIADEFRIEFDDGTFASCFALSPPEMTVSSGFAQKVWWPNPDGGIFEVEAHIAPEIFISEGSPNSIVSKWVERRGNGIHHVAYQVDSVEKTMDKWRSKGWAEFTTDEPISNTSGLTQCFTKPHELTGMVYEFIERGEDNKGFNVDNVRDLMESTDE